MLFRSPEPGAAVDAEAKAEVEWLIELISQIRTTRSELNVPPGARLPLVVISGPDETYAALDTYAAILTRLGRVEQRIGGEYQAQFVACGASFGLDVGAAINIDAEKVRLTKTRDVHISERETLLKRFANPAFVEKAKPEAVEKARADLAHHAAEAERLAAALARLG